MALEELMVFFKYMTLINLIFYSISAVLVMLLRERVIAIHGKMFGIGSKEIALEIYKYLAIYKVIFITFNLVPYLALCFMIKA